MTPSGSLAEGRRVFFFFVTLFAVVVALLFIFLNWYIAPTEPGVRKDLVLTLAQILGGAALLSGLYFTWRTLQVNREGQITERFTRAIDQLGATDDAGNPRLEIRLGGIYALERIARDSPERDYSTVMEILTAYVRENTSWPPTEGAPPSTDIQAILDVLGRREETRVPERRRARLDLRRANLQGYSLQKAHLEGANIAGARLEGAVLAEAHLERAYLYIAHLEGVNLYRAHLEGADLGEARLKEADLEEAHLEGADLREATGLTQEQIEAAYGDETTQLPGELIHPEHWSKSTDEPPNREE